MIIKTNLRRLTVTAMATAGMAAALSLSAAPAQAVSVTSTGSTTGLAAVDTVNVQLSFATGEAYYVIAQCNAGQFPVGRACNDATDTGMVPVASYPGGGENVDVHQSFTNTSFIPGLSPLTVGTDCTDPGPDQCLLAISTYDSNGNHVDSKSVPISFS